MKKMFVTVLAIMMVAACAFGALADVTLEEAKQIALDHAGVAAEDAVFTKAHADEENGRPAYEIEFVVNGMEYEFDIDAASGAILDFDADIAD